LTARHSGLNANSLRSSRVVWLKNCKIQAGYDGISDQTSSKIYV
jgi:hypothetical protein